LAEIAVPIFFSFPHGQRYAVYYVRDSLERIDPARSPQGSIVLSRTWQIGSIGCEMGEEHLIVGR